MRIYLVSLLGIAAAIALAILPADANAGTVRTVADAPHSRVSVGGCPLEDSCAVDYRPSARGPVWIVSNRASNRPTVRIYGCAAEDSCAYRYSGGRVIIARHVNY
jgi:hypothetical protein